MTIPGGYVAGDVLTAANMNLLPAGYIAGASAAGQTGITTVADITSATVTFTAVAGRRYKVTCNLQMLQQTSSGLATARIANGSGTTLAFSQTSLTAAGARGCASFHYTEVPGAGSVTYKLRADTSAGTLDIVAAGAASWILVEDIGT